MCYKKMDPEGYRLAMDRLNAEIEAERTVDFLLARIPLVPEYVRVFEANLPALEAVDEMLNRLRSLLDTTFGIDLWSEVKGGVLRCVVMRSELRRSSNGQEETHSFYDFQDYGTISGYIALRKSKSTLARQLRKSLDNLRVIDFGNEPAADIAAMTETEKEAAVKILTWVHGKASQIIGRGEEARRFFTPATVATINGWSQQEGCPIGIHFALDERGLHVARRPNEDHSLIQWPANFWNALQHLDPLSRARAA
jgi:hypothetical protein